MPTQPEAIIEAFKDLGGERRIEEIKNWVFHNYGERWQDFGTTMADMVPVSHGGSNSSTILSKYRNLKRVSRGTYCLVEADMNSKTNHIETYLIPETKNPHKSIPTNTSNYIITETNNLVELFSSKRLPFEPKVWLLEMKKSLRERLTSLRGINIALHATYISIDKSFFDVENVLFYNVGTSAFSHLQLNCVQFERVYKFPPPSRDQQQFEHYQSYKITKDEIVSHYWMKRDILAQWENIKVPKITSDQKPHFFWLAMKKGNTNILNKQASSHYGMELTINAPIGTRVNLIAIIKPLLDGLISAFSHHDGQEISHVVKWLSQQISIPESQVKTLLLDEKISLLGSRNLLYQYREGVKWNPEDDVFPFFKVNLKATNNNNEWTLDGEIFTIESA